MTCYNTFDIEPNTTNLLQQVGIKYDSYENEKSPWFVTYSDPVEDKWESISEEEYNSRLEIIEDIDRIDYKSLSKN